MKRLLVLVFVSQFIILQRKSGICVSFDMYINNAHVNIEYSSLPRITSNKTKRDVKTNLPLPVNLYLSQPKQYVSSMYDRSHDTM